MSDFAHIIVKRHLDCWSAWFESVPYVVADGEYEDDAIARLMRLHQLVDLSMVRIVTVQGETSEEPLEIRASGDDR